MIFNQEERLVLSLIALILSVGASFRWVEKTHPEYLKIMRVIDSELYILKVDVNKASKEELMDIPYIGEYTAGNIVHYREENGMFSSLDDLLKVKGIRKKNFEKFKRYLF